MALTKVSTDGVKDDAITSGKIPANAVGASELADNAVDTNAISNNAVTAGKTSGVQTTINSNAATRLILGSASANTLNASLNLTFNSNILDVNNAVKLPDDGTLHFGVSDTAYVRGKDSTDGYLKLGTGGLERARVTAGGDFLVNTTSVSLSKTPKLEVKSDSNLSADHIAMFTANNATAAIGISYNSIDCFDNANTATLHVKTNGVERLTISPTGNVGIGTISPSTTLSVINNSNFEGFNVKHSNLTQGIGIGYDHIKSTGSSANVPLYIRSKGSGRVSLGYDTVNKVQVDADGLKFNADTAAANGLDDYEEGTYTPTPNSGTANQNDGQYTKIGNFCIVTASVSFDNNGTSGQMVQISLPFTAAGGRSGSGVIRYSNASISDTITIHINGGHASMDWYQFGGSGFTYGEASNGRYDFCLTYRTT